MSIIVNLRAFGRQCDVQMEKIDLKTVLDNALLLLGGRIRLRSIKLVRHVEENLPMVWGNANQVGRIGALYHIWYYKRLQRRHYL